MRQPGPFACAFASWLRDFGMERVNNGTYRLAHFHLEDAFSTESTPLIPNLEAFAGKRLSDETHLGVGRFLYTYDRPAGWDYLEKAGLYPEEIGTMLDRAVFYYEHKRFPNYSDWTFS